MHRLALLVCLGLSPACKRTQTQEISGAIAKTSAPSPGPDAACNGLEFQFQNEEALHWAAVGTLKKQGDGFAIRMDSEVRFTSLRYGDAKTDLVSIHCDGCSEPRRHEFNEKLLGLLGTRVVADGTVRPAWLRGDAAVHKDTNAVQLGTKPESITPAR